MSEELREVFLHSRASLADDERASLSRTTRPTVCREFISLRSSPTTGIDSQNIPGPATRATSPSSRSMVAIDALAAVIWAAYLTLMLVVLSYFGFVVGGRQDLESNRSTEESARSAPSADVQSTS